MTKWESREPPELYLSPKESLLLIGLFSFCRPGLSASASPTALQPYHQLAEAKDSTALVAFALFKA